MDTEKLARTFVDLTDTLVEDFDVLDTLQVLADRTLELLGVAETGLMLADEDGRLRVAVTSSETARLLELVQVQSDDGPCLEAYDTGETVRVDELSEATERWPKFVNLALEQGFTSVVALPLRLRGQSVGAFNLFGTPGSAPVGDRGLVVAQAMADVCTIAILQYRLVRSKDVLTQQLQTALDSRVAIEQAKGVLAASLGIGLDEAFELIRRRARNERRHLSEVAREVVYNRQTPN